MASHALRQWRSILGKTYKLYNLHRIQIKLHDSCRTAVGTGVSESFLLGIASFFKSSGLQAAGYNFIDTDGAAEDDNGG